MSKFLEILQQRRTIYDLGKAVSRTNKEIEQLIIDAVEASPSAFNSQSSRVVILFNKNSDFVWNVAKEELQKVVPAEAFKTTSEKLDSFAKGIGTILFFENTDTINDLQEQFAAYADNFPIWSEQASGMAQLAVWSVLSENGIGASLQHYNPIIDEKVKSHFGISDSWKLRAQMPFGSVEKEAGEKAYLTRDVRFKTFE